MSKANQLLSKIGENMVIVRLLQEGVVAYNANAIQTNFAKIDLICPRGNALVGIQVKTSDEMKPNFPTGLLLPQARRRGDVEKAVIGPWVFVHAFGKGKDMSFEYYILTREEVIELILASNSWWEHDWSRKKPLSEKSLVGLNLSWITGEGEKETAGHEAFVSPIKKDAAKDAWDKITKL
jgi:hypothetical protein